MIIAKPTADSAAATVITKNTKSCPMLFPRKDEKVTNDKFAAFNINSMDMKTMIAFLRVNTPTTPVMNINALRTR